MSDGSGPGADTSTRWQVRVPWRWVSVVGLVAAFVGATYLVLPPVHHGHVAMPARDAAPEQVVAAYLDALNAHDCDTARALMTADDQDEASAWCDDVARLTHIAVHHHFADPGASGPTGFEEVANVPVDFDLDWRLFHDDGSMEEGPTTWSYLLEHDLSDSRWHIFGQGEG